MAGAKEGPERVGVGLPAGVKLVRTLEGHEGSIWSLAFHPEGGILASSGHACTVNLWDVSTGKLIRTLRGHRGPARCVTFDLQSGMLASAGDDGAVRLWDVFGGKSRGMLKRHRGAVTSLAFDARGERLASEALGTVYLRDVHTGEFVHAHFSGGISLAFHPQGGMLASGDFTGNVKLSDVRTGNVLRTLKGHRSSVQSVTFDPRGDTLASASSDRTVRLWEVSTSKLLRTLEGHTAIVEGVAFSSDGRLLASQSYDETIRLWNCATWETVAVIPTPFDDFRAFERHRWRPAFAFHPAEPLLASVCWHEGSTGPVIQLWELDMDVLLSRRSEVAPVHHTTAKIVLVGDHSVGKSALGFRMIHGRFEKQESTHGQQFWVFPELGKRRADGTECEAILWDFAGQPDYRLVHALFVDNTDLALVLFDASDLRDPLHGVDYWLKQLRTERGRCRIVLVAAQTDRGSCALTQEELSAFCRRKGIAGPVGTSALLGAGIAELIEQMKTLIPWEDKAATVTTATFKRIKDYVLGLKETKTDGQAIVTPEELRQRLSALDREWEFTDAEMMTAVGHLENYGYVKRLRTSKGEDRILLQPELLNNLASSFVLEARRNPKGLGALEEKRLLTGGYTFPELKDLGEQDREVLLDSAVVLFLEHNVCFRETDPLRVEPYLVFPELINLKRPLEEESATEEGVAYAVRGPTENVFASLVVLLGYTHTFTRTAQWQNNARYEMGQSLVCGFRQEAERDGELDFVLSFGAAVGAPVRTLFQGLFESFLARRNLTVMRLEPVQCRNRHQLNRAVVREAMQHGDEFSFCSKCGDRVALPKAAEPIQLTREVQAEVEVQRRAAEERTRFEQAVFRVRAYAVEQKITPPETFISYAWGVAEHERWVEKRLATDLQKAGVSVVLDRWHNAQVGASVARFVERIEKSDRIVMVGTPLYRRKYDNKEEKTGYIVAAEVDLINNRLLGTEREKESVLPVLLDGDKAAALPPLLHGRVYADFRDDSAYFRTAFDLILSLYEVAPHHPVAGDLRESLSGRELG